MSLQEQDHPDQEILNPRPSRLLRALGSACAASTVLGAAWFGMNELNSLPVCGETIELGSGTPKGYLDIEGTTFAVDVYSQLGTIAVTVTQGDSIPEMQKHTPTSIPLLESKDKVFGGSVVIPESGTTLFISTTAAAKELHTACKTN